MYQFLYMCISETGRLPSSLQKLWARVELDTIACYDFCIVSTRQGYTIRATMGSSEGG